MSHNETNLIVINADSNTITINLESNEFIVIDTDINTIRPSNGSLHCSPYLFPFQLCVIEVLSPYESLN